MPITKETKDLIRKYAIKNAIDYGEARMENVLGKVIKSVPKDEVKELRLAIEETVRQVNSLNKEQLEKEYASYEQEFEEQYEKKAEASAKPRMELEGAARGDFASRFAPEPSGYLHIGHASAAFLASEFAKIYEGQVFLYFDDTNPEKEKQEFVDSDKKDLAWLSIKFDKEYYASDNIENLYKYAKQLIKSGKAYACDCTAEQTKKNRFEGIECKHRNISSDENLKKFQEMLDNKYDEERIVIRIKGDMKSLNTALRDPTILRIKKGKHYRQGTKYIVWPTYDFNTPINDSMNGITDAIRTTEYGLRGELYDMVLDYLQLRKPRMHLHARISIKGQPRQKREIRKLIEDHLLEGFDDPRLVTIAALRRRGVQPDAIKDFVLKFGMSTVDNVVDISPMFAESKRLSDPNAKRLYYVESPVTIDVKEAKTKEVEMNLHPSNDLGSRKYKVGNKLYISKTDAASLKDNDVVKLKGLFNLKVKKTGNSFSGEITQEEKQKGIQWVSEGNYLPCKVLIPTDPLDDEGNFRKESLLVSNGYVESYASSLKEHEVVQFERFGFCVLDDKKSMQFILLSK